MLRKIPITSLAPRKELRTSEAFSGGSAQYFFKYFQKRFFPKFPIIKKSIIFGILDSGVTQQIYLNQVHCSWRNKIRE